MEKRQGYSPDGIEFNRMLRKDWRAWALLSIAIFTLGCSLLPSEESVIDNTNAQKTMVRETHEAYKTLEMDLYIEGVNATPEYSVLMPTPSALVEDAINSDIQAESEPVDPAKEKVKNIVDDIVKWTDLGDFASVEEVEEFKARIYLIDDSVDKSEGLGTSNPETKRIGIVRRLAESENIQKLIFSITHEFIHFLLTPEDWRKIEIFNYDSSGSFIAINNNWQALVLNVPTEEDGSLDFLDEDRTKLEVKGEYIDNFSEGIVEMFTFIILGINDGVETGHYFYGDVEFINQVVDFLIKDKDRFKRIFSLAINNDKEGCMIEFGRILSELRGESVAEEDLFIYALNEYIDWVDNSVRADNNPSGKESNIVPFNKELTIGLEDFREFNINETKGIRKIDNNDFLSATINGILQHDCAWGACTE